jgi:N-acetylglucosaminyldiphosphoundecaprenol N-acetyl-beta-D-mannosaminyltransferase
MVQMPQVVELLEHWIEERQSCHYIVATGMHGIMEAHKHLHFKAILNSAALFIPDGISLIWIARWRGFQLKNRVCGSDLMGEVCRLASQRGYRNFFYGDTEETLQLLTARLQEQLPGLTVAGIYSPPFRPLTVREDEEVVRMVNKAAPDILWVGLGCPKQEQWMYDHRDRLSVPVMVGVGAAFKFLSGRTKRAPTWVGDHGLEWVWRFFHEPRRVWRRVLIDGPHFACLVALELSRLKRYG